MASKSGGKPSDRRAGKRKDRNQRMGQRVPELGYYLIVTDTEETEKNYFEGLRDSIPAELKDRLIIKVEKARTVELVEKALELVGKESQYRIPWIVFDRDQVKGFDEIIWTAEKNGVHAGWSNPCFDECLLFVRYVRHVVRHSRPMEGHVQKLAGIEIAVHVRRSLQELTHLHRKFLRLHCANGVVVVPRVGDGKDDLREGHGRGRDHTHAADGQHRQRQRIAARDTLEVRIVHLQQKILQCGDVLRAILVAQHPAAHWPPCPQWRRE